MVANAVLINVVHGEGVSLPVVLAVAGALDGTMTRSLNDGKRDQVLLQEKKWDRKRERGQKAVSSPKVIYDYY